MIPTKDAIGEEKKHFGTRDSRFHSYGTTGESSSDRPLHSQASYQLGPGMTPSASSWKSSTQSMLAGEQDGEGHPRHPRQLRRPVPEIRERMDRGEAGSVLRGEGRGGPTVGEGIAGQRRARPSNLLSGLASRVSVPPAPEPRPVGDPAEEGTAGLSRDSRPLPGYSGRLGHVPEQRTAKDAYFMRRG